jgi:hypothetical protein
MSGNQQLLLGQSVSAETSKYVENVYSTFVYKGNGTTQNIDNGVNLVSKGALVWFKSRNNLTFANAPNCLTDSVTGYNNYLSSNSTTTQQGWGSDGPAPKTNGFNLPINGSVPYTNYLTGNTYASWTFAEQPKFFDIVSLNNSTTTYNHNLGSTPAFILVKCTNGSANWVVYHQSLSNPRKYRRTSGITQC